MIWQGVTVASLTFRAGWREREDSRVGSMRRLEVDLRLELITVPVLDVDRAEVFYVEQVGFTVEQDYRVGEGHRFVELTPPGSPCSIALMQG